MPILNARLPKHSCHKAPGQGYVTIDGKRHYTGKYGTPQAQAEYNRMLAEWIAAGRPKEFKPTGKSSNVDERLTVKELMLAYWRHAETFYRKGDHQTGEVGNIRAAFKHLKKIAGDTAVDDFGPVMLKAVRQSMIEAGNSRTYINRQISRIRTMFSWGVENELVPVEVANALRHVKGLP